MNKYLEKIAALTPEEKADKKARKEHKADFTRHYRHNGSVIGAGLTGAGYNGYLLHRMYAGKSPLNVGRSLLGGVYATAAGSLAGSGVGTLVGKYKYDPSTFEKKAKASDAFYRFKSFYARQPSTVRWAAGGAVAGGALGATRKEELVFEDGKLHTVKLTPAARAASALNLGTAGALLGSAIGSVRDYKRYARAAGSGDGGGGGSSGYGSFRSRTIHDIHDDLGMPKGGFKTKTEAKSHVRKFRSQYHPDKHPGKEKEMNERMAKFNRAWDEYEKHPDGFTKLANAYLMKAASIVGSL